MIQPQSAVDLNAVDRRILRAFQVDGLVAADMAHYARFVMDTLLRHPSVQDCKTSFVLDQVKTTTALPV